MYQGRMTFEGKSYDVVDAKAIDCWHQLPYSLRILFENALRSDPHSAQALVAVFKDWVTQKGADHMIDFKPSRVLMQDLTGVPAVVDLAAMRDAFHTLGGDVKKINPLCRVDLVADHSVTVGHYGDKHAYAQNTAEEIENNIQRYTFLKWAQENAGVNIVPPGTGICHQVNLERLATVVTEQDGQLYPDTMVGLDSHTTMINGVSVLGWGVGGIEAEAAMLGQPIRMVVPDVIGVELRGKLQEGVTATDMVLALTQFLRGLNVVGKFVEFHGEALRDMALAERATVANMSPEFGATCAFFPCDEQTLTYLRLTGRSEAHVKLVEAYNKHAGLMYVPSNEVVYSQQVVFDLAEVVPCVAGPKRPEQMLPLPEVPSSMVLENATKQSLSNGSVVIAAITSCTNTSNPAVMIGAGLLARKALEKGLSVPAWVKTSLAPGSKVVMRYLDDLGLTKDLEKLGFYLVGFGCTTCIGNSGPLDTVVSEKIASENLQVCSVLSGNRNFEGRVHPLTNYNYLASPPLVVAYALCGTMNIDISKDIIGHDQSGEPVMLSDIWPTQDEIQQAIHAVSREMFESEYADVFSGTKEWQAIDAPKGEFYRWDERSTYIKRPAFLENITTAFEAPGDLKSANILALLGDSVTTDHISPAGHIQHQSAAGEYLADIGVDQSNFHSYGSRRGNAEVMVRGTLANHRLNNQLADGKLGGYTKHIPSGEVVYMYDAAKRYEASGTPLVIVAGQAYGTGSSRDWAAKGVMMLGVKVVLAKSFERIHRSNLIGMGVLPCVFKGEVPVLDGTESLGITGISDMDQPRKSLILHVSGHDKTYTVDACIDTDSELAYFQNGGILPYVLRRML